MLNWDWSELNKRHVARKGNDTFDVFLKENGMWTLKHGYVRKPLGSNMHALLKELGEFNTAEEAMEAAEDYVW